MADGAEAGVKSQAVFIMYTKRSWNINGVFLDFSDSGMYNYT